MGRLVAISTEKKKEIESPATDVAQGKHGRLVKIGDTQQQKPFSTSKTTTLPSLPATQQQTNTGGSKTLPSLRDTLTQGSFQKSVAPTYSTPEEFETHAAEMKTPTLGERVANTLHGAAKQYASGLVNLAGLSAAGQNGTAVKGSYEEQIQTLDDQIASLEATLDGGTLTPQQRKDTQETIALVKQQRDNYANAVRSGDKTADAVYQLADEVANSGAQDIEYAKRGAGKLGQLAVDVGVAGAQMGGDIALGALTGGGALVPMFARSMGGSAQEARQEGASHGQQVAYGTASGALSVATEKIANVAAPFKKAFGGGVLDKAIDGALAKMDGSAVGKLALSFLSEGGEEMIEDVVQPVLKSIYNRKSIGQNYSELELEEVLYDGLIGGILGGIGGGIEAIGSRAPRDTQTRNTPTVAAEGAQERAESTAGEITLPTAENAPTAQDTGGLDILRRTAEETAGENDSLSGGKRMGLNDYATPENMERVSQGLNDGTLAVDANNRIYRTNAAEHIDRRNSADMGNRKVNAFQFDHPELHQYYREAAAELLDELSRSEKGGEIIHRTSYGVGDDEYFRTKRAVTERIGKLLDAEGISYANIEKSLNAIINDSGQENFAAAKKVELMLDDMLSNGYRSIYGETVAPNEDYIAAKQAIPGADTTETTHEELPIWDMAEPEETVSRETVARNIAQVRDAATALGQNGSRALSTVYNETNAGSYAPESAVKDFYQVYNAALNGKKDGNTTAPDYLRLAAQNAGERDARVSTQAKYFGENAGLVRDGKWRQANLTSKESYALDALGKVTGTEIRFADSVADGRANAEYKDGVITLALDAEDPVMTSAVHETVHRLRETAPEMYQELANFVLDNLSEESAAFNLSMRAELYETGNVDVLTEETVADAFGRMLEKSDVLEQFATEHRSAARKLMDALHDLVVKLKRALNGGELRLSENQKAAFRDLSGKVGEMETLFAKALETTQEKAGSKNAANEGGDGKFSIKNIVGDSGKQYGIGVYLDNDLLTGLSDAERKQMVRLRVVEELAGNSFIAYDNGNPVEISIAHKNERIRSNSGNKKPVLKELYNKHIGNKTKQEAVVLADELIEASKHDRTVASAYSHEWLDNYGKNNWEKRTVYLQDKNKTVWEATLQIANSADGRKILYDIDPIKMTEGAIKSAPTTVTSTVPQTGNNVKTKFSLKTDSDYLAAVQSGDTAAAQKMVDETAKTAGYTIHAYHGTARSDRVGTVFRPDRATSGPMAFFTSNKEIAQNYARDKADTSIAYDTEYDDYYTQFRVMKSGKSLSVGELWGKLTSAERAKIKEAAPHIRFDEDYDQIIYDPTAQHGNGAYDAYELNRNKGNVLNTLVSTWLETGDLYDREADFLDVLKLAGVKDAEYRNPDARSEKVYDTYLKIQQPFDTATVDKAFYNDLSAWLEKTDISQYQKDNAGADMWDKNAVTPERFLERLADDIETGTSHVWTSIPDYVTAYLQEQGYDGIKDTGGKGGGENHMVWIPFSSEQVKSSEPVVYDDNGEVIPLSKRFNESEQDIRYSLKTREALDEYIAQYGEMPAGETPHRRISVPKRTAENKYVSQTIRTVLEAKATPDALVPTLEGMVAKGDFSYDRYTDKQAVADAESKIETQGWQKTLNQWKKTTKNEVSKEAMATGWALYNNAATSGDVETALDVLNDMVAKSRNAAQALQAVRLLKKQEPSAQLYGVQRSVENLQEEIKKQYGKNAPELEIDRTLAEKFLNAETDEAREKAMSELYRDIGRQMPSRFIDRWNAWRYLSMLGNPRTHVRNIVGNAGFAPLVGVKNVIGAGLESAANAATGGKVERTKAILTTKDTGIIKAAWNDYANIREQALGEGKYNESATMKKGIEEGSKIFGTTGFGAWDSTAGKGLEAFRKFNGTALDMEDMWFSKPHYAAALAMYCKANGITAEQIASGKGLERARNYAIREAQKATYRDTNAFSQMVSELGRYRGDNKAKKAGSVLLEGILPFRKTPANILVRGVEYSPIGLGKAIVYDSIQVGKGNMEASEMLDHLSAGLTGTGVLALGVYMASQGLLRGSGGGDEDKKDFDSLRGHQDYALELPNGASITLDWLAPEVLPLFIGANLYEQMQSRQNGELAIGDVLEAISNVSDPLLEMSCLQSLNDLFDSVGYASSGDTSALASVVSSAATSYLTQAIPTVFGQIERTGENIRMTTYTDKNNKNLTSDMQYTLGKASAKIPGVEYNQIPYIDAWGRTESTGNLAQRAGNNFLNPAYVSAVESSTMEDELERLYEATGDAGVLPDRAKKYINADGETKNLTAEEYVKYATEKGQTAYKAISEIVKSDAYKALSDEDKADAVGKAYTLADAMAKMSVSDYTPSGGVEKGAVVCRDYGIDPAQYITLYTAQNSIESLKDSKGETISLSQGLLKMELIYQQSGLSDKQRAALFEAFNVPESIRHYNKALVDEKLRAMRKKAR